MAELRLQGIPATLNLPLMLVFRLDGTSFSRVSKLPNQLRAFQERLSEPSEAPQVPTCLRRYLPLPL
jgi:hypothetical protein